MTSEFGKHLKTKTDAECRELAVHYYHQLRKMRKEADKMRSDLDDANRQIERLGGILCDVRAALDEES